MLEYIQKYFDELWFLLLEMAPWLLLGLIFAGVLKVYFPQKHIDKYTSRMYMYTYVHNIMRSIGMTMIVVTVSG